MVLRERAADQGDQPAAAALALRGEQGGAGHARLPVLHVVRHATSCARAASTTRARGAARVFVASDFAKQIADIEKGRSEPVIHVGNLEARRDFTDVRDMVRALLAGAREGRAGRGLQHLLAARRGRIREMLDLLLGMTKMQDRGARGSRRACGRRDVPILLGDARKFRARDRLGADDPVRAARWRDMLDYWRRAEPPRAGRAGLERPHRLVTGAAGLRRARTSCARRARAGTRSWGSGLEDARRRAHAVDAASPRYGVLRRAPTWREVEALCRAWRPTRSSTSPGRRRARALVRRSARARSTSTRGGTLDVARGGARRRNSRARSWP